MTEAPFQQTEQQEAQHTLTVLVSKATAILSSLLLDASMGQDTYMKLAGILQQLTQQTKRHIDRHQSIYALHLSIGGKETSQKAAPLMKVVNSLNTGVHPQRIPEEDVVSLVSPSIIPGLFMLQTQRPNGDAIHKRQHYYLVGPKHLPKGYQHSLSAMSTSVGAHK